MKQTILVAALVLLAACSVAPAPARAAPDALSVFKAWEAALNAHDVEAEVALFAPGAAVIDTLPGPGASGVYVGPNQLRALFTQDAQVHIHSQSNAIQVQADERVMVLDSKLTVDAAALPPGAPQPIESTLTMVVQDGKIRSLVIENTPAWVAKLLAVLAAPPGMPTSGQPDAAPPLVLLALAGLLGVGGILLRRSPASPYGPGSR